MSRTTDGVGYTPAGMTGTPPNPRRGLFISIDGPDGGGKTTQAERLRDHLAERGVDVLLTREPGGTWLGERLRAVVLARTSSGSASIDPLTDAFLFDAARRQIVCEVIRPALAMGTTVICARFADSTIAYQGYGAGVPIEVLRTLERLATDGLAPDRTIVLDLPVETGLARKAGDAVTRFEAEFDADFHQRVRAGFLAIATAEPDRVVVVDATAPVDEVASAVAAAVRPLLEDPAVPGEPDVPALRIHP
jgi:dTMP kinase